MDGITILRSSMILSEQMQFVQAAILIIAMVAILIGLITFYERMGLPLIMIGVFLLLMGVPMTNHFPSVMRHEITVSDDVSFNELNEHYRIISIEDNVITVEEHDE